MMVRRRRVEEARPGRSFSFSRKTLEGMLGRYGRGGEGERERKLTSVPRVTNQLMGLSSIVAAPFELAFAITFLYQQVRFASSGSSANHRFAGSSAGLVSRGSPSWLCRSRSTTFLFVGGSKCAALPWKASTLTDPDLAASSRRSLFA